MVCWFICGLAFRQPDLSEKPLCGSDFSRMRLGIAVKRLSRARLETTPRNAVAPSCGRATQPHILAMQPRNKTSDLHKNGVDPACKQEQNL
jgi:hypothetical protein